MNTLLALASAGALMACMDHPLPDPAHGPVEMDPTALDMAVREVAGAVDALYTLSPHGVAVGEVHGNVEGLAVAKAFVERALADERDVVLLLETGPEELGVMVPSDDYHAIDPTDPSAPLWSTNLDKRGTWELLEWLEDLVDMPKVEISYLLTRDSTKAAKGIQARGMAERWHVAQQANPDSFLVGWMGNYHASVRTNYPLDVTNSVCRYLLEVHGYKPTCMRAANSAAPDDPCPTGINAKRIATEEPMAWPFIIERPDGCTRMARWVGNTSR